MFHIFGSLPEFERDLIQERTKAGGLTAARARGRPTVLTPAKAKQVTSKFTPKATRALRKTER